MTAETLFIPKTMPDFDNNSADADLNNDVLHTDSAEYGDVADDEMKKGSSATKTKAATESEQFRKLQKKLRRQVSWAIRDFNMIEDGDVIMVCVSGGKDSYTLLDILLLLKRIAPISFDIVAVNLDQKQPGYPEDIFTRLSE